MHSSFDTQLPLSLKLTYFRGFSLSLGGFGRLEIRQSSDPHLKHLRCVGSVLHLSESPTARAFPYTFLSLKKSTEWLAHPQRVHFF